MGLCLGNTGIVSQPRVCGRFVDMLYPCTDVSVVVCPSDGVRHAKHQYDCMCVIVMRRVYMVHIYVIYTMPRVIDYVTMVTPSGWGVCPWNCVHISEIV